MQGGESNSLMNIQVQQRKNLVFLEKMSVQHIELGLQYLWEANYAGKTILRAKTAEAIFSHWK